MRSAVATPHAASRLRTGARAGVAVRIVGNETRKTLLILWSRRATLLPQLAAMAVMYPVMQYLVGGGSFVDALLAPTLLAFVAYVFGYIALLKMSAGVAEELNTGTLAQTHLSPAPAWMLSAGRVMATLVEGTAMAIPIAVAYIAVLGIDIPLRGLALIPLGLTVVDLAGFALLIGGLTLVIPSISAIVHVLQSAVMFLNGALIPVHVFPLWLEVPAMLVPSTLGIDTTRQILFEHASLTQVWSNTSLPLAALHAAVMLTAGWLVYQRNARRLRREGGL